MSRGIDLDENTNLLELNNENEQTNFLQSTLGRVVNFAVDTGIRAILPDFIEDEIINIKDTIVNNGFSDAINETIKSASEIGKNAIGVITGNFENISQAEKAIEKGGLINGISNVIDFTLDRVEKTEIIPKNIVNLIREGKDVLLGNVTVGINNEFSTQNKNIENLENYTKSWREGFENQDLKQMDKYIKKIKNTLNKIMPLENLITEARQIENLHELIKNNGGNFNLSNEELDLAKMLSVQ